MLKHYKANHVWNGTQRFYKTPVGPSPGVTTVLSNSGRKEQGLINWRTRIGDTEANKVIKDACDRGTYVHSTIERFLLDGIEPNSNDSTYGYFESIKPVLGLLEEILLIEGAVWSPKGYAGTVDCIATIDGVPHIVDWKTATKPKRKEWINNYLLQLAAYAGAANHVYPDLKVNRGIVAIALPDQLAQIFIVDPKEMMGYWREWLQRVEEFKSLKVAA
jgi:PD-(D/E)XK nuclease superfamily protein